MTERNTILMDLDTGEWIAVHNIIKGAHREDAITGEQGAICASSLLPGTTAEQVAEFYAEYMDADPAPEEFPVGSKVRMIASGMIGTVTRRAVSDGELHTLAVGWHHPASGSREAATIVGFVGPREVEAVKP